MGNEQLFVSLDKSGFIIWLTSIFYLGEGGLLLKNSDAFSIKKKGRGLYDFSQITSHSKQIMIMYKKTPCIWQT